jgi:hypothetical protein
MSRTRIATLVFLMAVIGAYSLMTYRGNQPISISEHRVDPIAGRNAATPHREISDSNQASVHEERSFDCIPRAMVSQNPDAYRVDEWYRSWGAPPSFNVDLSNRPYAHYKRDDLQNLSDNGDVEATHELGRNLVWRAFRGGEKMPDYETLWEIGGDRYPYDGQIDMKDLERGREHMYRAAIEGRIYALIDISLSFAHQAAVETNNGKLDEERQLALRIEAFAYGEAVEKLIKGIPPSFFQVSIPEGKEKRANAKLSAFVEHFALDRAKEGLDASTLPTVSDDVLLGLNICVR